MIVILQPKDGKEIEMDVEFNMFAEPQPTRVIYYTTQKLKLRTFVHRAGRHRIRPDGMPEIIPVFVECAVAVIMRHDERLE